jgi:hypothetical protein
MLAAFRPKAREVGLPVLGDLGLGRTRVVRGRDERQVPLDLDHDDVVDPIPRSSDGARPRSVGIDKLLEPLALPVNDTTPP